MVAFPLSCVVLQLCVVLQIAVVVIEYASIMELKLLRSCLFGPKCASSLALLMAAMAHKGLECRVVLYVAQLRLNRCSHKNFETH